MANQDEIWKQYIAKFIGAPPRPLLLRTLELWGLDGTDSSQCLAIDLGCGGGQDTIELLKRGWNVLAVDREVEALRALEKALPSVFGAGSGAGFGEQGIEGRFEFLCASFEDVNLPPSDFINASYSLPFCERGAFADFWSRIITSVQPGGRFAGQFFGPDDDWVKAGEVTGHDESAVRALLSGFEIEHFDEMKERKPTALGREKNWHVYSVIAKRV